jgi:hypothetical protein
VAAVVARVLLHPSRAFPPHLRVTRVVLDIDGLARRARPPAGGTNSGAWAAGALGPIVAGADCSSASNIGFTTPGRHEIAVWVVISGQRLPTPLRATIDLSCADADAGTTEVGPSDAGPPDQVTVAPAPDAGPSPTPPAGNSSRGGGGCAVVLTPDGFGVLPALAIAALALALRRTRRVER